MTERFDTAKARAELENTPGDIHDKAMASRKIAYAALDELDCRDKEAAERQVTDDGRLKYRGCKPNEHGELIPIPDGEAEEPPATDDTVFEAWWKENEHEPYTDRTWAMLGWQERGRRAEVTERELRAQHTLDAETVLKLRGEYNELEKTLRAVEIEAARYQQEHEAWEWLAAHSRETLKRLVLNECRWLVMPAMSNIPWDALPKTPLDAVLMAAQLS